MTARRKYGKDYRAIYDVKTETLSQADRIFNRFGGPKALSDALNAVGLKINRVTVYRWNIARDAKNHNGTDGLIPIKFWTWIFKAAELHGVVISADDCDPRPTVNIKREHIGGQLFDPGVLDPSRHRVTGGRGGDIQGYSSLPLPEPSEIIARENVTAKKKAYWLKVRQAQAVRRKLKADQKKRDEARADKREQWIGRISEAKLKQSKKVAKPKAPKADKPPKAPKRIKTTTKRYRLAEIYRLKRAFREHIRVARKPYIRFKMRLENLEHYYRRLDMGLNRGLRAGKYLKRKARVKWRVVE